MPDAPYRALAALLREKITEGVYGPGDRLPSIPSLSRDQHVSGQTAQRAMDLLRDEGLTESVPGRGTFVRAAAPASVRDAPEFYAWEKQRARRSETDRASTGTAEFLTGMGTGEFDFSASYQRRPLPDDVAELFGAPRGTVALRRTYETKVRSTGLLTSFSTSYLPLDLVDLNPKLSDADNEPWPGGTQHQLATVGVELADIVDEVTARAASADDRRTLALPAGSAVLVIRKVSRATDGRVVEVSDSTRPARGVTLRYRTDLDRWEA